jgi:tetratricopeptide (TPR) repeat protein
VQGIFLVYPKVVGLQPAHQIAESLRRFAGHFVWPVEGDTALNNQLQLKTSVCVVVVAHPGWRDDKAVMDQIGAAERFGKNIIVADFGDEHDVTLPKGAVRVPMSVDGTDGLEALLEEIEAVFGDAGGLRRTRRRLEELRSLLAEATPDQVSYIAMEIEEHETSVQLSELLTDRREGERRHSEAKQNEIREQRRPRPRGEASRLSITPPERMIGREREIEALREFLSDTTKSIALISGPSGAGKTALAAYVLADGAGDVLPARRVVYERLDTGMPLEFADVYEEIAAVTALPGDETGTASAQLRIASLLDAFPTKVGAGVQPVLLLDGLDGSSWSPNGPRRIDPELVDFLKAAAGRRAHELKIVVTTTGLPRELDEVIESNRTIIVPLAEGLGRLEGLDLVTHGDLVPLQLRNLDEDQISALIAATSGMPQALLTVRATLVNSNMTLEQALDVKDLTELVTTMLGSLDFTDKSVVEALAVFGMPVTRTAVDDVVATERYVDTAGSLRSLTRRSIVIRQDDGTEPTFDLHSAVRREMIKMLELEDGASAPFGFFSRLRKVRKAAAKYLSDLERPIKECREIDDVRHHRARFAICLQLEDFKAAGRILDRLVPFLRERGAHLVLLQMASGIAQSLGAPKRIRAAAGRIGADALLALGRPLEALRWQEEVLRESRATSRDLLAKGRYLRTVGEFAEATNVLLEAIGPKAFALTSGVEAEVWCELGTCSFREGVLDEALTEFGHALQLGQDPLRRSEYLRRRADVYLSLVQPAQAKTDLEEAKNLLPPADRQTVLSLADIQSLMARVEFQFGNYDEAVSMLRDVIDLRQRYGPQPVLEANLTRLGRLRMLLGQLDAATELVRRASYWLSLRKGSDYQATMLKAQISACRAEWSEVQTGILAIATLLPEHGVMVRNNLLGLADLGLDRRNGAQKRFGAALENADEWLVRCATNPEVVRQRALALAGLAALGERPHAAAVEAFEKMCELTMHPGSMLWNRWWVERLKAAAGPETDLADILAAADGRVAKEKVRLRRLENDLGKVALEKITQSEKRSVPVGEFQRCVDQAILATCAIQDLRDGVGTGFLIAPDLVLTNFHVIEDYWKPKSSYYSPENLVCLFDYALVDGKAQKGVRVRLAPQWLLAHRTYSKADLEVGRTDWSKDELDYAVLRLERPIGAEPSPQGDERRGWIDLGMLGKVIENGNAVKVLQHSRGLLQDGSLGPQQRMELSDGEILGLEGGGLRVRHSANTLEGASGSMCLDVQFNPIALHHAGAPDRKDEPDWKAYHGKYNQAIPLRLIAYDLLRLEILESDEKGSMRPGRMAREGL